MKLYKYILFTIFLSAQSFSQTLQQNSKYTEQRTALKLELEELQAKKNFLKDSKASSAQASMGVYVGAYLGMVALAATAGYLGIRELTHTKMFHRNFEKFLHSNEKTQVEILDGLVGFDYTIQTSEKPLKIIGIPSVGKRSCFGHMRMTLTPELELFSKILSLAGGAISVTALNVFITPEVLQQMYELDRERYESRTFTQQDLKKRYQGSEMKKSLSGNRAALEVNFESAGRMKNFLYEGLKKQQEIANLYLEGKGPTKFEDFSVELVFIESLEAVVLHEIWLLEELSKLF